MHSTNNPISSVRGSVQACHGLCRLGVGILVAGVGRDEPASLHRHSDPDHGCGDQQVPDRVDVQSVHRCTAEGADDGADAERGVEAGHDRTPDALLDGGALDVLGDVPLAGAEASDEQPDRDHRRPDAGADRHDRESDRIHH